MPKVFSERRRWRLMWRPYPFRKRRVPDKTSRTLSWFLYPETQPRMSRGSAVMASGSSGSLVRIGGVFVFFFFKSRIYYFRKRTLSSETVFKRVKYDGKFPFLIFSRIRKRKYYVLLTSKRCWWIVIILFFFPPTPEGRLKLQIVYRLTRYVLGICWVWISGIPVTFIIIKILKANKTKIR